MRLKDKTAVVTGAASGIGRATAETLAAEGAYVFLGDIDEEKGRAAAAELSRSDGDGVAIDGSVGHGHDEAVGDAAKQKQAPHHIRRGHRLAWSKRCCDERSDECAHRMCQEREDKVPRLE